MTCRTGCRRSEKNLVDASSPFRATGKTLRPRIETLSVLLMKYQWSREPKWNRARVSTAFTLAFRRTQIAISALNTKITRASCRRCAGTVVPRAEHFGDLITADHKILSEESESRNNHRYAAWWYKIWQTQWSQSYPCKTKNFAGKHKGACKSSWNPRGNQKVIYTDNSLECGKSCEEIILESLYVKRHTDQKTNGIAESAVRRVKEVTSCGTVAIRSGQ